MGKFLGILLGLLLVVLFTLLSWQLNPEKTAQFLPVSVQKFLSGGDILSDPILKNPPRKNAGKILEELPEQELEELSDTSSLLLRGENFMEANLKTMAINDFSRAAELSPQSRQPWNKLVGAQISTRDFSGAAASLDKALTYFPNDKDFLVLLGEVQLQKSQFIEAKNTFSRLPAGGEKSFYSGIMAAHFQQFEEAKTLFTEARNAGFAAKAQLFIDAFDQYELFPEGNPLHLRLMIAKAFNDLRFFELAIDSTKSILKERGDYRDAWIILGHSYLSLERHDLAENVLQEALKFDPTKPETSFFLATAEAAMGQYDDAVGHFSLARENGYVPQAEVTAAIADSYLNGGFYEAARKEYEKLVEVRTASVEDYEKPIRISLEYLQDAATAQTLAMRAIEVHPNSVPAKNLLIWAFLEGDQLGQARILLEEVLVLEPENALSHRYMGDLFVKEKNIEQALESYKKAYELSPHSEIGAEAAEKYNLLLLGAGDTEMQN